MAKIKNEEIEHRTKLLDIFDEAPDFPSFWNLESLSPAENVQ